MVAAARSTHTPTSSQQPVENVERARKRERDIYICICIRVYTSTSGNAVHT